MFARRVLSPISGVKLSTDGVNYEGPAESCPIRSQHENVNPGSINWLVVSNIFFHFI